MVTNWDLRTLFLSQSTHSSDIIFDFVLKASFDKSFFSHLDCIRMCTYFYVTTVVLTYAQVYGFNFHICRRVLLNSGVAELSKAQTHFRLILCKRLGWVFNEEMSDLTSFLVTMLLRFIFDTKLGIVYRSWIK